MIKFIAGILLCSALSSCYTPDNVTMINELRDFTPLFLGDEFDYYLSTNPATAEDAGKVCESIGKNFHLVSFENETEYRRLLPYLRSLEIQKVWTSGQKYLDHNSSDSQYVWTRPSPSFPMAFTNFPSYAMLAKLTRLESLGKKDLPRCKNGFLTPKCKPGNCEVNLPPCTTLTPECSITECKPCTVTQKECGASCNNCTIEEPVCFVVQKPCNVKTKPCTVHRDPCKIETPECKTVRPPCYTTNPPCLISTPKPCTTTQSPCSTTQEACTTTRGPCTSTGEKCPPPVTFCKPIFKCEPEICQPGAIICPTPIITCPPEQTVCTPPVLVCPKPLIVCPDPEVDCPKPIATCSTPKVTCDAPEISCPGIVVNCPAPSYHCDAPVVDCPPPEVTCDEFVPCEYPTPPTPCPTANPNEFIDDSDDNFLDVDNPPVSPADCDDCLPKGCIALRKETDFKYKLQNCSDRLHFLCEGR